MYENSSIIADFDLPSKPYFHWTSVILVVKKFSLKPSLTIMCVCLLQLESSKDMIIDSAISFGHLATSISQRNWAFLGPLLTVG